MIKPLKLQITPNQGAYFLSDTHFGHDRDFIWGKRGFSNVKEHDETLIRVINETVKANDVLIHHGDFCLNTSEERFEEVLSLLNCKNIYLLWGNHNAPVERVYFREVGKVMPGVEIYPFRYKNLIFVGNYLEIDLSYSLSASHRGGKNIICCHYPIHEFNNAKRGNYMLCGHSHYGNEMTRAENPKGRYLDLGWEGHGRPLSFLEVREIMNKKEVFTVGHH